MRSLVRPITQLAGVLFLLVGIAAFFTGNLIVDIDPDMNQNILHIITGLGAFWAAANSKERFYLLVFGLLYALITILYFVDGRSVFGLIFVDQTEMIIYAVTAVIFIVLSSSRKS